MIVLFSLLDFICAILIILGHFHAISWKYTFLGGLYMGLKGYAFRKDWMSKMDFLCGVYLLFLALGVRMTFFTIVFFLWIAYKTLAAVAFSLQ
ncbi:MAG: hypothetical protein V1659_00030 [Candidatus Woesearchaeota archaeon]